jgi:hypothetical protein
MKPGRPVNIESSAPDAETPQAWDNMGKPTHRKSEVRLGREVQARIGQQLRALYDEVVKEGVPQNIADLVRRLGEQDEPTA